MTDTELYHYGVKGMKWGVRRYKNKDGSLNNAGKKKLSPRQVKKSIEQAKKTGRLFDTSNRNVWGVKQKNGDVLFVSADDIRKLGVDAAEKKTLDYVKARQTKVKKGKTFADNMLRREEKSVVDETIRTYDKTDPDREEALKILRKISKDIG